MAVLRNAGRVATFILVVTALVAAVASVVWFLSGAPSGGGAFSVGLCNAFMPNSDSLIGVYLDANAAQLEQPAGEDGSPVTFVVEPGESAAEIAQNLRDEGLVSDAELFRRYVQYHGLDAGIEAGEFTLRRTMTIAEIATALQRGVAPEQTLLIREGLRLEEIAESVGGNTTIPQEEFLALVTTGWRDPGLGLDLPFDPPPDGTLEGLLFPDTYRLPDQASAVDLLLLMLANLNARVGAEVWSVAAERGLAPYELLTLASIVEREAVLEAERPLIAGVYVNRLEAGWLLNADPTVQYAVRPRPDASDWWPVLSLDDLDVDSPYNTYLHLGLPPTPICNPGLSSIAAAAQPASTDYFYFLADCGRDDGSHLFSVTEEEHLSNYRACGGVAR